MANWWEQDELVAPAPGGAGAGLFSSTPMASQRPMDAPAQPNGNWWEADELVRFAPSAMGTAEAFGRGAERGVTFGFGDEARGVMAASTMPDSIYRYTPLGAASRLAEGAVRYFGGDAEAEQRYTQAAEENRQLQAQAQREHPWATMAGEVVGGVGSAVATGGAGIGARAVGLGGRMVRGAVAGGAAGGLYGAGTADGDLATRGWEAGKGALIGAPLGAGAELVMTGAQAAGRAFLPRSAAAPSTLSQAESAVLVEAGLDPRSIGDDAARALIGRAQQFGGVSPATVRQAAAQEFDVPLTRGQATGNVRQSAFEEEARSAARGEPAANILKGFDARQGEAVQTAREGIQRGFAGAYGVIDDVSEVGAGVTGAVRDAERGLNARVGQAYERAGQTGATISADSIRGLPGRIHTALDDAAFIVDDQLTPSTQAALREMNRVADVEGFAASRGVKLAPGQNVAGVNLQGLDFVRKRINGLFAGNLSRADRMGLTTVKREFDTWLDDAVENSLISGDEGALAALKEARGLRAEYGRKFEKHDRFDDSGGLIQRILRQDVTPHETVNMLYGLARIGEQGRSVRLAKDLRDILGRESEGWAAIRQGAFLRMTMAGEGRAHPGAQAVSERIGRFVNGDGVAMSRFLFSEEERQLMTRFSKVVGNLVPPKRSTNPSGSGMVFARRAEGLLNKIAGMLGFGASGGNVGVAAVAAGATKAGLAGRNLTQAVRSTMPVRVPQVSSPATAIASGELGAAYGLPMLPGYRQR